MSWVSLLLACTLLICGACAITTTALGTEAEKPVEISIMNVYYDPEPPRSDNPILLGIQEHTNTKLNITWVPSSAYTEKVNATLAAGELPEVLLVTNNKSSAVINAVRAGMFWEVGPHLEEFESLAGLNEMVFNAISVDGKIYGLYRTRWLSRVGLIFRADWLEALGREAPRTMDEVYEMLVAFTHDDPDGNGQDDTYGLAARDLIRGTVDQVAVYYGAPNNWGLVDDQMTPAFMSDAYKQSLDFFRRLYAEKLINQDFAVSTETARLINTSKAGAYFAVLDDAETKHNDLYVLSPEAKLDILQNIEGPMGERVRAESGYNGVFMFSKTSVKTEEKLLQILRFFNDMDKPAAADLIQWGVEGAHYDIIDGFPTRSEAQTALYVTEVNPIRQLGLYMDRNATPGNEAPIAQKYKQLYAQNEQIAVPDLTLPLISETNLTLGSELNTIINDAIPQYIMGEIDEDGWAAAIERWLREGGVTVMEEYTAAYHKAQQ